jgi:hypothetical protein
MYNRSKGVAHPRGAARACSRLRPAFPLVATWDGCVRKTLAGIAVGERALQPCARLGFELYVFAIAWDGQRDGDTWLDKGYDRVVKGRTGMVRFLGEQTSGHHFNSMSKEFSPLWMVVMPEASANSYCLGSTNHWQRSVIGPRGVVSTYGVELQLLRLPTEELTIPDGPSGGRSSTSGRRT